MSGEKDADDLDVVQVLEWLVASGYCPNLIYDDNGFWAVSSFGMQNIRADGEDLEFTEMIEGRFFKPSIREAIKYYVEQLYEL
jgi:hypothetical protein